MIVSHGRRHALAAALFTALTTPAAAADFPYGILVQSGSALSLASGDIVSVSGTATGRAITVASRASFDATGAAVSNRTSGNPAGYAYGLLVFDGSDSDMQGGAITMLGDRAVAVQVQGASRAVFRDIDIATAGNGSLGIAAVGGADIDGQGTRIEVTGTDSTAVLVRGGAHVGISDGDVLTRQAHVGAVVVDGMGSTFTARRSRIAAQGEQAWAITGTGGEVRLHATRLEGAGGVFGSRGPGADPLRVHLMEGSRAVGHVESGRAALLLRMEDSELVGDMHRRGTGELDAGLTRSRWMGRATGVDRLRLDASDWSVTGEADVGQLTLAGASTVAFAQAGTGFASLRVGRLDSTGGEATVRLRTRLDAGGAMARQATDRLLVQGDALGTTRLDIVPAGGRGAATAPGAGGGISVAQVGGAASEASFRLAGDYVVVGPWRYGLHAYAPGEADASQRRVAGNGSDYWDFRLQSTRIDRHGRAFGLFGRSLPVDAADDASHLPVSRAALAPQVPAYLALAGALFGHARASLDAAHPDDLAAAHDAALRVRGFGGHTRYRSTLPFDRFGVDSQRSDTGVQVAGDLVAIESDASHTRAGIVASVGRARIAPRAVDGVGSARSESRALALTYALRADAGWRVDAAYAVSHHRVAVRSHPRGEALARLRANGNDASLAGTLRWSPTSYLAVDPGASLLWQRQRFTSAQDRDGIVVRLGAPERLTLRAGMRAALAFVPHGYWLSAWSAHVYAGYATTRDTGTQAVLSGIRFATGGGGRQVDLAAGMSAELRGDITLSVDIDRRVAVGGAGESGLALRVGLAMTF
ncbi:autotransporter outer membrane beta-barrel domain-containing protein [Luteibacter sp. 9135]|uniref:autotransporter outer membrane beta-barrel domain-containing protein n=1 Tax=Luteibacter sp. 9135 TaxID=1500893 RepID=UPI0005656E05|nr:autotransporter outer membrane beta-barrel domain-containing protein [Luteibacter sp. 9135]